ncbi:MAG: hypothetical protein Q8P02_00760 [Candidatus Micrarchaeota archaeon]|nr:hypothetical protein [Candidatus Micrarchaeota archaeon]
MDEDGIDDAVNHVQPVIFRHELGLFEDVASVEHDGFFAFHVGKDEVVETQVPKAGHHDVFEGALAWGQARVLRFGLTFFPPNVFSRLRFHARWW